MVCNLSAGLTSMSQARLAALVSEARMQANRYSDGGYRRGCVWSTTEILAALAAALIECAHIMEAKVVSELSAGVLVP